MLYIRVTHGRHNYFKVYRINACIVCHVLYDHCELYIL